MKLPVGAVAYLIWSTVVDERSSTVAAADAVGDTTSAAKSERKERRATCSGVDDACTSDGFFVPKG